MERRSKRKPPPPDYIKEFAVFAVRLDPWYVDDRYRERLGEVARKYPAQSFPDEWLRKADQPKAIWENKAQKYFDDMESDETASTTAGSVAAGSEEVAAGPATSEQPRTPQRPGILGAMSSYMGFGRTENNGKTDDNGKTDKAGTSDNAGKTEDTGRSGIEGLKNSIRSGDSHRLQEVFDNLYQTSGNQAVRDLQNIIMKDGVLDQDYTSIADLENATIDVMLQFAQNRQRQISQSRSPNPPSVFEIDDGVSRATPRSSMSPSLPSDSPQPGTSKSAALGSTLHQPTTTEGRSRSSSRETVRGKGKGPETTPQKPRGTSITQSIQNAIKEFCQDHEEEKFRAAFQVVESNATAERTKERINLLCDLVIKLPPQHRPNLTQMETLKAMIKYCQDMTAGAAPRTPEPTPPPQARTPPSPKPAGTQGTIIDLVRNAIREFCQDQNETKLRSAFDQIATSRAKSQNTKDKIALLRDLIIRLPSHHRPNLTQPTTLDGMITYCQTQLKAAPPPQSIPTPRTTPPPPTSPPPTTTRQQPPSTGRVPQPPEDPPRMPQIRPVISDIVTRDYPPVFEGQPIPQRAEDWREQQYRPAFDKPAWFDQIPSLDNFGLSEHKLLTTATKNPHRPRCFSPYTPFDSAPEKWFQMPDPDLRDNTLVWAYKRGETDQNRLVVETESLDGRPFSRAFILMVGAYSQQRNDYRTYMNGVGQSHRLPMGSIEELRAIPLPFNMALINNVAYAPQNGERASSSIEILTFNGWKWSPKNKIVDVFGVAVGRELNRIRPREKLSRS